MTGRQCPRVSYFRRLVMMVFAVNRRVTVAVRQNLITVTQNNTLTQRVIHVRRLTRWRRSSFRVAVTVGVRVWLKLRLQSHRVPSFVLSVTFSIVERCRIMVTVLRLQKMIMLLVTPTLIKTPGPSLKQRVYWETAAFGVQGSVAFRRRRFRSNSFEVLVVMIVAVKRRPIPVIARLLRVRVPRRVTKTMIKFRGRDSVTVVRPSCPPHSRPFSRTIINYFSSGLSPLA